MGKEGCDMEGCSNLDKPPNRKKSCLRLRGESGVSVDVYDIEIA